MRPLTFSTPRRGDPMTHPLPAGYTHRPATLDDAERVTQLWNDRTETVRGERPFEPRLIKQRWNHPKFDLKTDSRMVLAPDGSLVGYAHVRDVKDPPVDVFAGYTVRPDHDDADWLWEHLFAWLDKEARRVIPKAPADARIALVAGTESEDKTEQERLESFGFEHERTFHRMKITFADTSLSPPDWPEGITVRGFVRGVDDEALVIATQDAFRDHYGFIEQPIEAELAELRHWLAEDDFDAELWNLACEGEEIAGFCACLAEAPGEPDHGVVDVIGVRPAWHRRGLGRALLHHAFAVFAERGIRGAVLTVDTDNKHGAPTLYEKVGMRRIRSNLTYVKELRPASIGS